MDKMAVTAFQWPKIPMYEACLDTRYDVWNWKMHPGGLAH